MSKSKTPTWRLNQDWGVSVDGDHWVLLKRAASGKRTWSEQGHYASAEILFHSLHRKLTRSESTDQDLIKHLENCVEAAQRCVARLNDQLRSFIWRDLRRSAARRGGEQ